MAEITTPLWRDPVAPLIQLLAAFGIDAAQLKETRRAVSCDVRGLEAAKLTRDRAAIQQAVDAANAKYGPALTFQLRSEASVLFDRNDSVSKLDRLTKYYDFFLKIDKAELLVFWHLPQPPSAAVCLYLDPEALRGWLESPLTSLDHGDDPLFESGDKLVILVPARKIALEGSCLAIVGGEALASWESRGAPPDAVIQSVYATAREALNWAHEELQRITPLHLSVAGTPERGDPLAAALAAQLLTCSILYVANRSMYADSGWTSWFHSSSASLKIKLPDAAALAALLRQESADDVLRPAAAIAERVIWMYEDAARAGDRLRVAQDTIVEMLKDGGPATACRDFVRAAGTVKDRILWAWEAFVSGQLQTYFAQVKQLVETIDSAAKSYNEQVQTLTKTLIDNMLAAMAVVVGSFIAAMFKQPFNANVFLFGTGAYMIYLVVFPMGVGLTSTWQRFRDSRKGFQERLEQFQRGGIPGEQVKKTVGDSIAGRERWFTAWWWATGVLYLIVVVVLVWVAAAVTA